MCRLCKKVSKAFYGHNKKSNVTNDTFETKEVQEEKEMDYKLDYFPYLTQTDNKLFSSTTCYPTSMAMTMKWCLKIAGYSEYEIAQKREALENVLIPFTIKENIQMCKDAGFKNIETVFQWANFVTFIVKK